MDFIQGSDMVTQQLALLSDSRRIVFSLRAPDMIVTNGSGSKFTAFLPHDVSSLSSFESKSACSSLHEQQEEEQDDLHHHRAPHSAPLFHPLTGGHRPPANQPNNSVQCVAYAQGRMFEVLF